METNEMKKFENAIVQLEQNDDVQNTSIIIMKQQIIEINSNINITKDIIHEVQELLKTKQPITTPLGKVTKLDLSKTIPSKQPAKRANTTREMKPLSRIEEHIYDMLEGNKAAVPKDTYTSRPLKRSINMFIK
jgi:hypothetical protein